MAGIPTQVQFYQFNLEQCEHKHLDSTMLKEDLQTLPQAVDGLLTWINVDGIHDPDFIRAVCKHYGLHHLVVEDLLNPKQRPKLEEYENTLVIVTQMLDMQDHELDTEQLTVIVRKGLVVTFQEHETWSHLFDPIRKRATEGSGRTRKRNSDYLMYSILDSIVDHNLHLVEQFEEEAESHEEALMTNIAPEALQQVYFLRMKITRLRQRTRPTRELIRHLMEEEHGLIEERTKIYLRDVHDHAMRIADSVESLREMITGIIDLHISQINNRMSEVMKFLTMISAMFVPLNLIAAIYGMNFKNMPELNFKWGYFITIAVMCLIATGMLSFYRKKQWF